MYTYEELRDTSMEAYPRLFAFEEDFLDHIFFVNGNGYDWIDGAPNCEQSLDDIIEGARIGRESRRNMYDDDYDSGTIEEIRTKEVKYKKAWLEVEGETKFRLYPLCKYALIVTIPDNITPEWYYAAWKAVVYALENLRYTERDLEYIKRAIDNLIRIFRDNVFLRTVQIESN